jgi:hypothetical protein
MRKTSPKDLQEMHHNELPTPSACPTCGTVLEASAPISGRVEPRPNDISICFTCGAISQFNEDLTFRLSSLETLKLDSMERARLQRYVDAIKARRRS